MQRPSADDRHMESGIEPSSVETGTYANFLGMFPLEG